MNRLFRLTPSRLAIAYIAVSVLALALFAVPLWYAWRLNYSTLKTYVDAEDTRKMVEVFGSDGAKGLAAAIDSRVPRLAEDEIVLFADASRSRIAGNLPEWPKEMPDSPGTSGLVIDRGGSPVRIVVSHLTLPGGYHLLTGRESVRFQSLVTVFWYDAAGAVAIVLVLGVFAGWLIRRALVSELQEVSSTASAIAEGDFSRRVPTRGGSDEMDVLARTVNGMLDQLATQNRRLEEEIAVRRQAELALHRVHDELEEVVAKRTAELAQANESLERTLREMQRQEVYLDELFDLAPAAVVLTSLSPAKNLRINREFTRMFGYTSEEAVGKRLRNLIAPDELAPADLTTNPDLLAGRTVEQEVVRQRKDGTRFHAHITAKRIRLGDSEDAAYIIYRDITERKQAEQALRLSEERYARSLEATEAGHWEWDLRTDEVFHSARFRELHGVSAEEVFTHRDQWKVRQRYLPGERERQEQAIRGAVAGPVHHYEIDLRIEPRPGEIRWLRSRGKLFGDEAGQPMLMAGTSMDVTEHKLAELTLAESESRFRSLTQLSNDFFWETDAAHRYTAFERGRAYPGRWHAASKTGKAPWEIPYATPDEAAWNAHRAAIAARQRFFDFGFSRIENGEERFFELSGEPRFDAQGQFVGYRGVGRDVTQRKRAEEELRRQKTYLDQLFDLAPVAIILNTLEPRTLRINKEFTRMFGYEPAEVVGHRIRDLILPEGARGLTDDPRWLAGERIEEEVVRRRKDGSLFHAHVITAQIPFENGANASYVIYHDITERKRTEEALRLSERRRRQTQRLEAMGTLAGGIAHDFNNILGAILGYGEMALRSAAKGSRLRRDVESILTAGERGRALVDRVLTFSRSGVAEKIAVHVEKVVVEALEMMRPNLPNGITIESTMEAGRAAISGEPTQVHQVLTNLATNAIHAMPAGGTLNVSLRVRSFDAERAATIGTIAAGEYVVLEVADSGTGIAPATLDRIFEPFFTTKDVNVGTGLGLSLVHGIVADIGGAIDVASAEGVGSSFTVYLPRAGDTPVDSEDARDELPQGDGQRVLVVDDEEPLVRLATETLAELGYAPVGFTSSTAALEAFRADPRGFAAVITDERMPEMSGSALIREVRRMRKSIPVLLVSGYVGGIVTNRAYNEGADEVLKKPLSAQELATSLARVLHQ